MGKSTPSAPDPTAVAQAQTQSNEQTAQYQQQLNELDTLSPYGSVNYTPSDAPGGSTVTTTLSPAEQAIFDQSTQAQSGALGLANTQLGRVGTALGTSIDPSSFGSLSTSASGAGTDPAIAQAQNAAYSTATQYLNPQIQQQNEQSDAALAAQGLNPNDAAWQNAKTNLTAGQNQAYTAAENSAVQAGDAEQNTLYGQNYQNATLNNTAQQQAFNQGTYAQSLPINEFDALLGSGQVTNPTGVSYTPSSVTSTNVGQIYQNSYQDQLQNAQIQNNAFNSGLGGLFNLGASFI